jgi:hypothetical protein
MKLRRAGRHGLHLVQHKRIRLVLNLHEARRLLGDELRLRHHDGHFIPVITHVRIKSRRSATS